MVLENHERLKPYQEGEKIGDRKIFWKNGHKRIPNPKRKQNHKKRRRQGTPQLHQIGPLGH